MKTSNMITMFGEIDDSPKETLKNYYLPQFIVDWTVGSKAI